MTPIIVGEVLITPSNDGRTATMRSSFVYKSQWVGAVTIFEGEVSDYNSTPWIAWRVFPPWQYPLAAFVHDHLYCTGRCDERRIERWEADLVHREILRELGAPRWKSEGAYLVLTAAGWKAWNRYRALEDKAGVS